ncbi:hypothetical protein FKM82_030797 [Ascaphus truei]
MGRMLGLLLLLAGVSGILAQTDMTDKVFLFPRKSPQSYVRLMPAKSGPFERFTVCLRSYTDRTHSHSLFSLATPSGDNDFHLFFYPNPVNALLLSAGPQDLSIHIAGNYTPEWKNICVSWDSSTGVVQAWVNGKPYPRKVFQKGYHISENPIIVIGQFKVDDKVQAKISFVGEIRDVHMYDEVLTEKNIATVSYYTDNGGKCD